MSYSQPRYQILLKEIELIHGNIKNLDDIIFKMKNFAFLLWGGSLYLIAEHLGAPERAYAIQTIKALLLITIIIPFAFWMIHVRWQRHISMSGAREKMISFFINSPAFDAWLAGDQTIQFPVYDPPAWIYVKTDKKGRKPEDSFIWEEYGVQLDSKYLVKHEHVGVWDLMWYKDAAWFYPVMIFISLGFSAMY